MSELPIGSALALLPAAPHGAKFGTLVTTAYSALAREIKIKGKDARFAKIKRGKFALQG